MVRVNNFVAADKSKSRSRSRKAGMRDKSKNGKKFNALNFCDDDEEEDENSEEENPFQTTTNLLSKVQGSSINAGPNLFFGNEAKT